jgi:hypothetical protein
VVNKSRRRQVIGADGLRLPAGANSPLTGNPSQMVGDHTNPILRPQAAEIVKKLGEVEASGVTFPNPRNQCWPEQVPFIFANMGMQLVQQANKVTIFYESDHQVRRVRLNEPHTLQLSPSWYGDSVGHYEGDTLVIDTIGITIGPYSMVDWYGTPYTQALHVVERYRLIDEGALKEAEERVATELVRIPFRASNATSLVADPNFKGKQLQLDFTVEDEGVFTMPWSATVVYRRSSVEWPEHVCAESLHATYIAKHTAAPRAEKPDF